MNTMNGCEHYKVEQELSELLYVSDDDSDVSLVPCRVTLAVCVSMITNTDMFKNTVY